MILNSNQRMGFNRDIVECKGMQEEEPEALRRDLIETLWNVKRSAVHFRLTLQLRFNRDIVECKDVNYKTFFKREIWI